MAPHRVFILLITMSMLFFVLFCRLFQLQTAETGGGAGTGADIVHRSVRQRGVHVVLDHGRGRIVDRNGYPLAGIRTKALLFMPSDGQSPSCALSRRVAEILGIGEAQASDLVFRQREPILWRKGGAHEPFALTDEQANALTALGSERFLVVPYVHRYRPNPLAAHVIGFLSEHPERMERLYGKELASGRLNRNDLLGAAGMERAFDRFLHATDATHFVFYTDGTRQRLAGLGNRIRYPGSPHYPLAAVTTLDAPLQARIEEMMDELGLKDAAVVVLDAANADVVAMASRPRFDPYAVNPQDDAWRNRALSAEIPGSVFKTVVAAAALEHGAVHRGETFECDGKSVRYGIRCKKHGGHGTLTLKQAFAKSCNVTFAEIAARLSPAELERAARSLGLLQPVGWHAEHVPSPLAGSAPLRQFDGEDAGVLFAAGADASNKGMLAQTGIGQRDVRISPLQAANMAAAIANGGRVFEPRLVSEIRYANNRTLQRFAEHPRSAAGLSPSTARWLREAMKLTVAEGTAKRLSGASGGVAGKTGTAEAGATGENREHHWFIGFTPVRDPKYAFAVMVRNLDGRGGEHAAVSVAARLLPMLAP